MANLRYSIAIQLSLWFCLSTACAQTPEAEKAKELPNDIKWVAHSVEYAALCEQIYRSAWPRVKAAASKVEGNWVVVFDVDETVLDNTGYALERAAVDSGYSWYSWNDWVNREEAVPTPGARKFIEAVRGLGPHAHVAFITNRRFVNEQPTIDNLRKFGMFKDGDLMLTRKSREDTKADRRNCLRTGTGRCDGGGPRVLLALFGDNIRDFIEMQGMEAARRYRSEELPNDERWGQDFFLLPNPTYGSWEDDYQ